MVSPSQTATTDTLMIAVLPQTGQHHRNANEVADAGQSQCVSGCFIGGTLLPYGLDPWGSAKLPPGLGCAELFIAPSSPWQNAYVERLIGTIRRECLDHMIVSGEAHLRRILGRYAAYYIMSREFIAHSTKMFHFPARLSTSASSHHNLSLAAFITNIAESGFRYTQWYCLS